MKKTFPLVVLLSSAGTLVCCVLPALFVALGAGAAFASLISHVPQLVWLSENKIFVFSFAAAMLVIGGVMQWRARNEPCPIDPVVRDACDRTRRLSLGFYVFSVILYILGFSFAYVIPWMRG